MPINKIKVRLNKVSDSGIFHDTRGDVKRLAQMCNILRDTCNELISVVNTQEIEIKHLKTKL